MLLLGYIPPRKDDAPYVKINKNEPIEASCWWFLEDDIILEMILKEKILNLRDVITEFWQKIIEMEAKLIPNTPPEVVKQW